MAYIGPIPAETFTSFATQEFSTSATTSYTLDHPVTNENELALFINNVRQQPGSGKAYTASGTALTLSAATASTDTMYAVFLGRALQTVNPADASVGTSQLAATSVTAAKLNNDIISGQTALAETPADTDELLLSDGGTIKRIDFSHLKSTPGLVHIQTQSVTSGVSSVDFTNKFDSTYNTYKLFISNLQPATDATNMGIQIDDGSGGFLNDNYNMVGSGNRSASASENTVHGQGSGVSHIYISSRELGNASDESFSAEITINKPTTTDTHKIIYGNSGHLENSAFAVTSQFAGAHNTYVGALVSVRLSMISGNINEGDFSLFGISTS